MNTCIKCGCQDAYPSLPPCPVPAACPNPQPCSEVFDAQCIVFTLPDILCGEDIVVNQDDTIAEALDNIVSYFCERLDTLTNYINSQLFVINNRLTTIEGEIIEINSKITSLTTTVNELIACCELVDGLVQSVTGLNTDNTDPQNPIVRISVDNTTITGLGTPASPLVATGGGVSGSGTNNYLARWTPSGTVLGIGLIQDNNTSLGIGTVPSGSATNGFITIRNATNRPASLFVSNAPHVNNTISFYNNLDASLASSATGIYNSVTGSSQTNIGISNILTGAGIKNTGVSVEVSGGALNYSLKLVDGTEGVGKVLTDVTGNGEAHWVTPTGGGTIGGSGTTDYVAKWTPNGTTLGNSLIRDNGTSIGIGVNPVANYRMNIETSTQLYGLVAKTSYSAAVNQSYIGISGASDGASTAGVNAGVVGSATGNTNINQGGSFAATSFSSKNVGVFAQALGATSNYAIQLNDGTNGLGKVLTCVGVQGEGNWGKVTSTYTTGASGSFVVGAQTITVTNGLITSIV